MSSSTKRKIESQPKLKLYYFNIPGKGEPIRLFCAYTGLDLDDYRFQSRDEFTSMKESGKLTFGQVPMLEVDEKHQLVQTAAILRYLTKLVPDYAAEAVQDPILAAKIDAAIDQETDAFTGMTVATYTTRFGIPLDDSMQSKSYELINNEVLPRHLSNLEKLLDGSTTGWICSTKEPSIADFGWFVRLNSLKNNLKLSKDIQSLAKFPKCQEFITKFANLDAIKEYYSAQQKE